MAWLLRTLQKSKMIITPTMNSFKTKYLDAPMVFCPYVRDGYLPHLTEDEYQYFVYQNQRRGLQENLMTLQQFEFLTRSYKGPKKSIEEKEGGGRMRDYVALALRDERNKKTFSIPSWRDDLTEVETDTSAPLPVQVPPVPIKYQGTAFGEDLQYIWQRVLARFPKITNEYERKYTRNGKPFYDFDRFRGILPDAFLDQHEQMFVKENEYFDKLYDPIPVLERLHEIVWEEFKIMQRQSLEEALNTEDFYPRLLQARVWQEKLPTLSMDELFAAYPEWIEEFNKQMFLDNNWSDEAKIEMDDEHHH